MNNKSFVHMALGMYGMAKSLGRPNFDQEYKNYDSENFDDTAHLKTCKNFPKCDNKFSHRGKYCKECHDIKKQQEKQK